MSVKVGDQIVQRVFMNSVTPGYFRTMQIPIERGRDFQKRLLPALSTYLGHVSLSATQRYLTMTPELLEQANRRFEHDACGGADAR